MQHLIKKQTIQLDLPKQLDAFKIQHSVSRHYWNDVLPLLEQVFNEVSVDEETLEIDKLDIDLGEISEKDLLLENWSESILAKIRKQLYEKISRKAENKIYNREMRNLGICRQWLFYMQKGWLPWNTLMINETWYNQVLEALAVDFSIITELKQLIRENANATRRIIYQHDESFVSSLIEILTAENHRSLSNIIDEIQEILSFANPGTYSKSRTKENRIAIWEQVLWLSVTENRLNSTKLIEKLLTTALPNHAIIPTVIQQLQSNLSITLPALKNIEERPQVFTEKKTFNQNENGIAENDKKADPAASIDEDGIYVSFAGQVLVHPFLHSLFKRLNLVNEGKFETLYAKQKALYLMHYLATGNISAEEYELVVPKLLCNWPLDMPVGKKIELTDDETSEAIHMLSAVIEQWTVLKNTSIDGLREGFLRRNGKIVKRNEQLYLQVEPESIDMLLDHLPWNLSMVKLSWMKELLRVEWR